MSDSASGCSDACRRSSQPAAQAIRRPEPVVPYTIGNRSSGGWLRNVYHAFTGDNKIPGENKIRWWMFWKKSSERSVEGHLQETEADMQRQNPQDESF